MSLARGVARLLRRESSGYNTAYYNRYFPYAGMLGELECTPLGVPAFHAAVDLKASMVGSLPPFVLEAGRRADYVPQLLYQPDPSEPRLTTIHKMVQSMVYGGEVIAPATSYDDAGFPQSLVVVDPACCQLSPDGLTWSIGNVEVPRSEVMHLPRFALPGSLRGVGSVELNRRFFQGVEAQERFQRDFYLNGGIPSMIVKMDPGSSHDDVEEAKLQWKEKTRSREPVFVPGGLGADSFQLSNEDQQYLQGKGFQSIEISNIVGLPASYVGAPNVSQVYSNINDNRRELVDVWLRMDLELIKWGFTAWLPAGQQAMLDTDVIVSDPVTVLEMAIKRMEFETMDEVRASRGLKPVPGGDVIAKHYSPPGAGTAPGSGAPAVPALSIVPSGDAA